MLLELAIGDAYGAGFEYAPNRLIREHNTLQRYVKHPKHHMTPGAYTDDTQMSIAIAEAMLSGEEWTPLLLADSFVNAFKRDPREGYAGKFYAFLQCINNGAEFLEKIHPKSEKSGAAMRACPLGLYANMNTVISRCTMQAKITHKTPLGVNAAVAASLMTHYFRFRLGPKHKLPEFLCQYVDGEWKTPWKGKVGALGVMSVRAALTAILTSNSMHELLKTCINYTGDVDTVATIALAAASCCTEIEQNIPEVLYEGLERGQYGYDYLKELDTRLLSQPIEQIMIPNRRTKISDNSL